MSALYLVFSHYILCNRPCWWRILHKRLNDGKVETTFAHEFLCISDKLPPSVIVRFPLSTLLCLLTDSLYSSFQLSCHNTKWRVYKCALAFIIFNQTKYWRNTFRYIHIYQWHLYIAPFPWHCQDHAFHDTRKVCICVKHSNVCHSILATSPQSLSESSHLR